MDNRGLDGLRSFLVSRMLKVRGGGLLAGMDEML